MTSEVENPLSGPSGTATEAEALHGETLQAVIDRAVFNADGLLPAVIQQWDSKEVLMLGWMDAEALRRTLTTGRVTFWSRSRQEYWRKGDTSGHAQYVQSAALDCDADTLLVGVDQVGAACHTGTHSCFDGRDVTVVTGSRPGAEVAP
jgi:phosphoribosyl-AMP cyclohydrolase